MTRRCYSEPLTICYHGTSEENAQLILRDGFLPYTWFARQLENAIGYGGPHIFEVVFSKKYLEGTEWQFRSRQLVLADRIVSYRVYEVIERQENKRLRKRIFNSNVSALDRETQTFARAKSSLLAKWRGKFVVVHGKEIVGPFETQTAAIDEGWRRYGYGEPILAKQVVDVEMPVYL